MKHSTMRGDALLLLAAALWGAAFVAQRAAMRDLPPLAFNGLRFALGSMVLVLLIAARSRIRPDVPEQGTGAGGGNRLYFVAGAIAGLVLFFAAALQQVGMVHTTAAKAGFITGLYVPLVPILGLIVGQRTGAATWVGAGMAVLGLYFLSVPGRLEINRGDAFVIACAFVWAVHVLVIGRFAPRTDPLKLALVQFLVVAFASLTASALTEHMTLQAVRAAMWPILYSGLFSIGIAFTLQVVGQRDAPPAHAALLLSLETVFAGLTGWLILGETFGGRELFGAAVLFAGMLASQLGRFFVKEPIMPDAVTAVP